MFVSSVGARDLGPEVPSPETRAASVSKKKLKKPNMGCNRSSGRRKQLSSHRRPSRLPKVRVSRASSDGATGTVHDPSQKALSLGLRTTRFIHSECSSATSQLQPTPPDSRRRQLRVAAAAHARLAQSYAVGTLYLPSRHVPNRSDGANLPQSPTSCPTREAQKAGWDPRPVGATSGL